MEKQKNSSPMKSIKKQKNREFAIITYVFLGMFLLMMGYFCYFQIFRSEDVINSPYNRRQDIFSQYVAKGSIFSADGKILAESIKQEDGTYIRYYPYGSMFAHAVGYDVKGKAGIESFANFNLLRSHAFFVEQIINGVTGEKSQGDQVITTLDYDMQEAAYQALGDRNGAVLALEASTGKILAMVSKPDFNPNTIDAQWDDIISEEENSVLLNRTTQGLYPPGSTFKILTTLQYLREHTDYENYLYQCDGEITREDTVIHCANQTAHGEESLIQAFAKSCNCAYSHIGLELEKERFRKSCLDLLFHEKLPLSYPFQESKFQLKETSGSGEVMQTAIGQGETLMTPMHMALLTCAIVNDGTLMNPYVVQRTENYKGILVKNYKSSKYGTIMEPQECKILKQFLEETVQSGTAQQLKNQSYHAAGKTGSAEFSNTKGESHGWFTGYGFQEEEKEIVVTVIVERGGLGSESAVPIAKAVFDAHFR